MLLSVIGAGVYECQRFFRYCIKQNCIRKFGACGDAVSIGNRCVFTESTLYVGSNVRIGDDCCFKSAHGEIHIGNHVMFGPGVHIHGGDHPIYETGLLLDECEKKDARDGNVTISDDCWIGARAIILKGVTIGKGAVVGAGAIVVHDVPPYTVYVGAPVQKEWPRFSRDELTVHLNVLSARGLR